MNLRPSGYEPDELPDCSTPRKKRLLFIIDKKNNINLSKIFDIKKIFDCLKYQGLNI